MSDDLRLPATAQNQVWDRGRLVDVGEPLVFDAHNAMIGLNPKQFSSVSREITSGGSGGLSVLSLASPETQKWWFSSPDHAYSISVDPFDFAEWLDTVGLTVDEAIAMDVGGLDGMLVYVSGEGGRPRMQL